MRSIDVNDDQREMKRHGTYEFPLAVYHYVMSDFTPGYINWHWHEEIQLSLVTRGTICFYADGQACTVREGEGFFINSGRLHMARPVGDPDSSYLCLDFHPRILCRYAGSVFEKNYVEPFLRLPEFSHLALTAHRPAEQDILHTVRIITALLDTKPFGWEMEIASRIDRLWLELIERMKSRPRRTDALDRHHDSAQAIIRYLSAHYQEKVALPEVARAVGFSESECCRLFRRVTGQTILGFLRSFRLSRAVSLLEESEMPVSEIAYECGFGGSSYFIECFRKELGRTPLEYRRARR